MPILKKLGKLFLPSKGYEMRLFLPTTNLIVAVVVITTRLFSASFVGASSVVVPDDIASVQEALASGADTIYVRPGTYSESPIIDRPVHIESIHPGRASFTAISIVPAPAVVTQEAIVNALQIFSVMGLDFASRCFIQNDNVSAHIIFTRSTFSSGIEDISSYIETAIVDLKNCHLTGSTSLRVDGGVYVDSCFVEGNIDVGFGDAALTVLRSTFVGLDGGTALRADSSPLARASVIGNTFRNYSTAIALSADQHVDIRDNTISNCLYAGISTGSASATISGNRVTTSSHGISVGTTESITVTGNAVSNCSIGLDVYVEGNGLIEDNVTWFCGGNGLVVTSAYPIDVVVANNTSCRNQGSGVVVNRLFGEGHFRVVRNIASANNGYGIHYLSTDITEVQCNDWYENTSGNVYGMKWSEDDFSEDPQFCDPENGDWEVRDTSPVANRPSCGRIGALGIGCGVTATTVSRFEARRIDSGVRINWEVDQEKWSELWLERREDGESVWTRPTTRRRMIEKSVWEDDESAKSDRGYWYRLMSFGGTGSELAGGPLRVDAAVGVFRLNAIGPIPVRGPVRIEFSLRLRAPVAVEVFDVQGRLVASLVDGVWPAGTHSVQWPGAVDGARTAPAGVYLVRYRYPGGSETRRVPLAR